MFFCDTKIYIVYNIQPDLMCLFTIFYKRYLSFSSFFYIKIKLYGKSHLNLCGNWIINHPIIDVSEWNLNNAWPLQLKKYLESHNLIRMLTHFGGTMLKVPKFFPQDYLKNVLSQNVSICVLNSYKNMAKFYLSPPL